MFEINKDTAKIYLKQKISNYDIKEFNIVLKSSQIDNQLRSCVSMVTISVLDTNFYAPIFRAKLYKAEIVENCEADTFVSQVQADDRDENRIQYSIENNHEFPFVVDKYTGVIRVNNRIDYEMKQAYEMQVRAFDGKFSDKSMVKITIVNVIDKAPSFEYNFYNFKIKIPYDVFIGQVKASDVEKTSNMTYSLNFLNQTDSNLFCITQTGTIYLCSQQFDSNKDNIDQVLLNFDRDEYKFNVSVKIYSDYLNDYLENSVECKIQIESKSIERIKSYQVRTSTTALNQYEANDFFQNYLIKDFKDMSIFVILIALVLVFMIALFAILVWVKCRQIRAYRKKLNTSLSTGTKSSSDMSCGSSSSSQKGTDTPTMFLSDQSKITILSDYLNSSQNRVPRMSYYSDLLTSASNGQSTISSPKLLSFLPPEDKKSFIFNQHEPLMLSAELNLENSQIYLNDSAKFQTNLSNCNQSLVKLVNIMNSQTNSSVVSVSVDGKEYEDEYAVASEINEVNLINKVHELTTNIPPVGFRDNFCMNFESNKF